LHCFINKLFFLYFFFSHCDENLVKVCLEEEKKKQQFKLKKNNNKKIGAEGLRPLIILFLNKIQNLAEEKLFLEELKMPNKFEQKISENKKKDFSRWTIIWNGHDLVLKILHWFYFYCLL
jgi:hypothetical protein